MKNFPNQYLPLLTGHIAVQNLDCLNDKPAQKLVLEIAEYLSADIAPDTSNKAIDQDFHDANRNQIAKRMDELTKINAGYSQRLRHLLNPPSCGACPFMTKFNDRYFCGIKDCYERKVVAWQRHSLLAASKKLGVDIYDAERDGNYIVLQDTCQNQKHAGLWEKKNKDLRFAFMADIDRKKYQSGYEECPRGCVVLAVGKTLENLLIEKEMAHDEKRMNMNELREKLMENHIDELLWEATAFLKVLDPLSDDVVMSLYDAPRFGWGSCSCEPPDEDDVSKNENLHAIAEHTRRELTLYMLLSGDDGVDDDLDAHETLSDLVADIQKRAKVWKVKVPAEFSKMAARYDAEIAEAVAVETEKKGKVKK
jgi:ribosomal protein S27AE